MPGRTTKRLERRQAIRSPFGVAADILSPREHTYLRDPIGWVDTRLGGFLYSKQKDISTSVVEHRYTAVKSCFDSGKSFLASALACWWLDVHPPGSAFVVTTAPTDSQVKAILWREIQKRFEDAAKVGDPLRGRVTQDAQWKINDMLCAYGRKPADYNDTAFQGIHERYVLVILDEADGIPSSLWDAVDGLVTNEDARVLAIGNPMDPAGAFAKACKPGSGWNVVTISVYDTPNFTDEEVPKYLPPLLVSQTWVEERKRRWGVGTPRWMSKVLGEFPDVTDDSLIEPAWVEAACLRLLVPDPHDASLGVDVARFGQDQTQIYLREGAVIRHLHTGRKDDTMVTAGTVARYVSLHQNRPIARIDDVGVGGGVTDRLNELEYEVVGLNGGWAANNPKEFGNARSEWYWNVRLMFAEGSVDIDPADEDLAAQLVAIKYRVDSKGKLWVESKDDMKKRGLPSPDRADALVYSVVNIAAPMMAVPVGQGNKSITGDLIIAKW